MKLSAAIKRRNFESCNMKNIYLNNLIENN